MRTLLCFALVLATVSGFSPTHHDTTAICAGRRVAGDEIQTPRYLSTNPFDDWTTFFSPQERQHRKEQHDKEMAEMEAAQKAILERRRDPLKMDAYHADEVARHEQLDHQRNVEMQHERSQEWSRPSGDAEKPYTKLSPPAKGHNVLNDWKTFFSQPEADHRRVQHHLEQLETADAEQAMLERRRVPAKMKAYKAKQDARHARLDKQHEIEAGLEFVEERVDPKLKEGSDFIQDVMKNLFRGNKKKQG